MAGKEKWCHNKSSWHFETENVPGKNKEEESLVLRKSGELLWHYDVSYLLLLSMALHNYIYIKHKEDSLVDKIARDHDPRPVRVSPKKGSDLESLPMAVEYSDDDSEASGCSHKNEYKDEPIVEYKNSQPEQKAEGVVKLEKKAKIIMKDGQMRKLKSRVTKVSKSNLSITSSSPKSMAGNPNTITSTIKTT